MTINTATSNRRRTPKIIKCPYCKKGRLCDVPTTSYSQVITSKVNKDIVIKCSKCGVPVNLEIR